MGWFRWLHIITGTFDFRPEASHEIECESCVGDGKFASIAGCSAEEHDLALGVDGGGMTEARLRHVAEHLEFLKRHYSNYKPNGRRTLIRNIRHLAGQSQAILFILAIA